MPELTSKKSKPTINTFDFKFFSDNKGKRSVTQTVSIITTNSYVKLSLPAYKKLRGPECLKVGIDINNKVICVAPALETEPYVIKPTAAQIERNIIYISKSRSVIQKLQEIGIPKIVLGTLIDGELLFKF